MRSSLRSNITCVWYSVFALLFIFSVGYDWLVRGPFAWHVGRPSAIEGGVEALVLAGILCFSFLSARRWVGWLCLVSVLLYLRRHNAELTLIVGVVYLEILLAIGQLTLSRLAEKNERGEMIFLLAGIAVCGLGTFLLSFAGWAFPQTLLIVFALVGGVSRFFHRGFGIVRLVKPLAPHSKWERVFVALTLAWGAVLLARTANVYGHDTLWYLGRGDVVYAPLGSVFDNLRLVSPVHYFPKLWETLLLPITAFDQLRVQAGVCVAFMFVAMVLIWQLCEKLHIGRVWRYAVALLLVALPAWANTALQLKSDILCTTMLLAMMVFLADWFSARRTSALFYSFAAAALAVSCKYTAIPFVAFAVVFTALEGVFNRKDVVSRTISEGSMAGAVTFGLCFCAALMFLIRTWYLAGAPTVGPDPLLSIWQYLGFSLHNPVGTLDWTRPQVWSDVPRLFYEWLWAPSYMPKIRITWIGNYWLLFLVFGFLLGGARLANKDSTKAFRYMMVAQCLLGLLIAIAWRYHSRGGDGNYYIFPVALVSCLSVMLMAGASGSRTDAFVKVALVSVVVLFVFHGAQSFVAAAWSKPGTRVLDGEFFESPFQAGEWRHKILKRSGIGDIGSFLDAAPARTRVVAYGFGQKAVALPVPTEEFLSLMFARPDYAASKESFLNYLSDYNIKYLLLANASNKVKAVADLLDSVRDEVERQGWKKLADREGTLYTVPNTRE